MEEGMQKLIGACLLLIIINALQAKAFAAPLNCTFTDSDLKLEGVESLVINEDALTVNSEVSIQLQHTIIKCGSFGRQHRFDGLGENLQIILKSCTDEAALRGHIIDSVNLKSAEIICD